MNKNDPKYPLCDMVDYAETWEDCVNQRYYLGWQWVEVANGFALKHDRFMRVTETVFLQCKGLLNKVRSNIDE